MLGFAEGSAEMRALLGNKGANLAEMVHVLGEDRVPGGFTITTAACTSYREGGEMPDGLEGQIEEALRALESESGRRLGDPVDPLLVSVRSGAPVSMPGMLDSVLNLGLNEAAVEGLAERSGDPHMAWDSRRRLIQMFSEVVRGVDAMAFEDALVEARHVNGVEVDSDLDQAALKALAGRYLEIFRQQTGEDFPEDPHTQLVQAVRAVFDSWDNDRAVTYRHLNGIADELGTAVTVQRMVFGNMGDHSGSGVAFTRDPTTGALTQKSGTAGCISETGAGPCLDGKALDFPNSIAVSPDRSSVYVTALNSNAIAILDRDDSSGTLSQSSGTAGCISQAGASCIHGTALDGPVDVTVSPDDTNVYVAAQGISAISIFDRDVPPETTIDSGPAGATRDSTPTFTFSSNEVGATFECKVDGGSFDPCSGPAGSHTAFALADGPHQVQIRAVDASSNSDSTPATRAFAVGCLNLGIGCVSV